ncbi:MAG: hypothetical protein FJY75_08835 [Candidatus Eisenbacteria bacterium]|uniref:Uncharacterized protein n=1 Tax=Eiseniibacteriota bacterium TaxID=2212470 RepID=A0A937XBM1_UNCEI|nr:hypothetical protein [Candidatus Eisenbacteria bacterium]
MSRTAKTVFAFGVYVTALGIILVLSPNTLLAIFGVPPTTEVWIRVLGVIVGVLGGYYTQAARHELTPFFRVTIWGRAIVFLMFGAFVMLGSAPPALLLFGVVDLLGAIWTAAALSSQPRAV